MTQQHNRCYDFTYTKHELRIISTSTSSIRKKKCRVSTSGVILFRVSNILRVKGFSSSYAAFDMTVLDLSLRLHQNQNTILRGNQEHITLRATSTKKSTRPFVISQALIGSRGDVDHKSQEQSEMKTYDQDTIEHGKDWNDFGSNFHLRSVTGTNEMTLNLGCTLQTPRCAFHDHDDDDDDDHESVLPSCCRRKLNEALGYITKLFNDNMIPHWIDYRTLIRSAVTTTTISPFKGKDDRGICTPNDRISTFTDADVGITQADFYKIFSMKLDIEKDGYLLKQTDASVLRLFVSPQNGIHVTIRGYSYYEDNMMYDTSSTTITQAEMIPVKHLTPIVLIPVEGVGTMPAPNNAVELVKYRFGDPSSGHWEPPEAIRESRFGRTPSEFISYASWDFLN